MYFAMGLLDGAAFGASCAWVADIVARRRAARAKETAKKVEEERRVAAVDSALTSIWNGIRESIAAKNDPVRLAKVCPCPHHQALREQRKATMP